MTEREDLAAVWGRRPEASIVHRARPMEGRIRRNCFLEQVAPKTERGKD